MTAETEIRNWRNGPIYWVICAALIAATGAVLGLWVWVDHTIQRDMPYPEITETGAIIFNCEASHRVGAQVWLKIDNKAAGYPITEGRACFDFSKWSWYLKDRKQFVPYGK